MKTTTLANEGLKHSFECVVPAEDIAKAMEKELKTIGQRVKIAGFRPGFVPIKILQQRYGKSVQNDVIRNLVTEGVSKAITDSKLRPALSPSIEKQDYQEGGALTFAFSVEVLPEVPSMDFGDIEIARETFELKESDIEGGLTRLAERSPKLSKLDEKVKAKEGNVVTMDFKGFVDGEAFEGGTAEAFSVEIGSGRLIAGFEDQLIGLKAGDEKEVNVTFPEEYFNKELAGKPAMFEVKVKEVSELQTPEITDDFARERGFADMRALREAVRDQMLKDLKAVVRTRLKKQLFDILDTRCEFASPAGMVEMEFNAIWQRLQQAKAQGDETVAGKSDAELQEEYRAIAERRVRLGILLAEIARRENLQVTREELGKALMQQASQYPGQEQRVVDFYRQNPDRLEELRGPLLEEKAVDWILSKVKFTDQPVSAEQLYAAAEEDEAPAPKKAAAKPKKAPAKAKKEEAEEPASEAKPAAKPKAAKKKKDG